MPTDFGRAPSDTQLPEAAIARSLRRILSQLDSGVEPVAGFQSAI
jgi:FXSXX-COOH protein